MKERMNLGESGRRGQGVKNEHEMIENEKERVSNLGFDI